MLPCQAAPLLAQPSHNHALLVRVSRPVILNAPLNLISTLLLFDFFREILLHVFLELVVEVICTAVIG